MEWGDLYASHLTAWAAAAATAAAVARLCRAQHFASQYSTARVVCVGGWADWAARGGQSVTGDNTFTLIILPYSTHYTVSTGQNHCSARQMASWARIVRHLLQDCTVGDTVPLHQCVDHCMPHCHTWASALFSFLQFSSHCCRWWINYTYSSKWPAKHIQYKSRVPLLCVTAAWLHEAV